MSGLHRSNERAKRVKNINTRHNDERPFRERFAEAIKRRPMAKKAKVATTITCPQCQGDSEKKKTCIVCRGKGTVTKAKKVI